MAAVLMGWTAAAVAGQGRDAVLTGTVVDANGQGVAGARVHVGTLGREARTDAAGRFQLRGIAAGEHVIRIGAIGYAPERRRVRVAEGARVSVEVELRATPLSLPELQVTATPGGGDPQAVSQAIAQLSGRALEQELGATVAQTLRSQPGVAVRSMGPAAAMPVMRGLTGDRVLVLQDGQRSGDLAGSADDHGVTIDPLTVQRIEVVRGPATLLYGNNALGGVVNFITGDAPGVIPTRAEWVVGAQAETALPGGAANLRGTVPLSPRWALTVRAGARHNGDMRIPSDPVLGERLDNTWSWNRSATLGTGYVGERTQAGLVGRVYDYGYGLPQPPGADPVSLRGVRREASGHAEVETRHRLVPKVELEASLQDYAHDELDDTSGERLQRFELTTGSASILARQAALGPVGDGAWGVSVLSKSYAATGPAALTPPAESHGVGVFGYQEVPLLADAAFQLGARYDRYAIASGAAPKFGPGRERAFQALSGSLGLNVPLPAGFVLAGSVARSFRAPTVEELFSDAPHAGTGAVELGNPELRAETGLAAEIVLRTQSPRWNAQVVAYRNHIDHFVHLRAVGDTVVGGTPLPVLTYAQGTATLRGAEGAVEWAARPDLVLGLIGDLVHAARADGTPLSYMPPPRLGASVRWQPGPLTLGADVHHHGRQDRVGEAGERPTPAHSTVRLHAGWRMAYAGRVHSLSLRVENLADSLHREATSRIKDFAPGAGRSVALLYRAYF